MKTATLVLLAISVAVAAGCSNLPRSRDLGNPEVSGQTLAEQVCSNCHGVTGTATSPNFPNLAGQPEVYLSNQLHELKGLSRRDPAGFEYMWGISRRLTDRQIQEIAAYFSAQQLRAQLRPGPRCPDASTDPAGEVPQVRAGNTRVADD